MQGRSFFLQEGVHESLVWGCDSPLLMGALHAPAARLQLKRSALPCCTGVGACSCRGSVQG